MTDAEIRAVAERVLVVADRNNGSWLCWAAWKAGIEPHEATVDVLKALQMTICKAGARGWGSPPLSIWHEISKRVMRLRIERHRADGRYP